MVKPKSYQVHFEVNDHHELIVHVEGVKGPACDAIIAQVREMLGAPSKEWKTPEYDAAQPLTRIGQVKH